MKQTANDQKAAIIGICVVGGFTFLFSCCMWVYWKRLTAAIDVTDASMDFLRATPKVVVIPIFYAIAQIIFTLFWMWIFASIISMQKIIPLEIQGFKIPMAKTFEWESSVITMAIYLVFALYWVTSYLDYEC